MTQIRFTVPGKIGGKARPRFARVAGGKVRTFNTEQTTSQEAIVRFHAAQAMRNVATLEGPLFIYIEQRRLMPKSWSEKKRAITEYVTGKPDCDNCVKLICDALNKIVWHDDSQIAELHFRRRYTKWEEPLGKEGLMVTVSTLGDEP